MRYLKVRQDWRIFLRQIVRLILVCEGWGVSQDSLKGLYNTHHIRGEGRGVAARTLLVANLPRQSRMCRQPKKTPSPPPSSPTLSLTLCLLSPSLPPSRHLLLYKPLKVRLQPSYLSIYFWYTAGLSSVRTFLSWGGGHMCGAGLFFFCENKVAKL